MKKYLKPEFEYVEFETEAISLAEGEEGMSGNDFTEDDYS